MVGRPDNTYVEIWIRLEGDRYVVDPNSQTIPSNTEVRWISEDVDVVLWFPRHEVFGLAEQHISAGSNVTLRVPVACPGDVIAYSVYVVPKAGFAIGADGKEPNIIID